MPDRRADAPFEARLRWCRGADRALDGIVRTDPAAHDLIAATLAAAIASPPRLPLLPLRSRRAHDGRALSITPVGRYAIVLAAEPSSGTVDVVGVLALPGAPGTD